MRSCIYVVAAAAGCLEFEAKVAEPEVIPRDWQSIAVGDRSSCGVTTDGELYCWGFGLAGALGIGSTPPVAPPTQVGSDRDWKLASVGVAHACALRTDDSLWCWGSNERGALGEGPVEAIAVNPLHVAPGTTW